MTLNGRNGRQPSAPDATSARDRLSAAEAVLSSSGEYAYLGLDDQNRWTVSSDTEGGHIDVRLSGPGYLIEVWDTSPGLFWDEEDERRFAARERLARARVPAIARGLVDPDQEVWWDDDDHGVGARVRRYIGHDQIQRLPSIAARMIDELTELLTQMERRLLD
jgi:hypothetical protein